MTPWACKDADLLETFFGPFEDMRAVTIEKAKKICAGCSTTAECLELGKRQMYGVWGGLSPAERGPFPAGRPPGHRCAKGHLYVQIPSRKNYCQTCNRIAAAKTRENRPELEPLTPAEWQKRLDSIIDKGDPCVHGHPRTADTIYLSPRGKYNCVPCSAKKLTAKRADVAARKAAGTFTLPPTAPTACRRGHPFDEHTKISVNGYQVCAECARATSAADYKKKKNDG